MSVWVDIHKRSTGDAERKEETVHLSDTWPGIGNELAKSVKTMVSVISYAGELPPGMIPNHSAGKLYIVKDNCSIEGKEFHPGDMIIDTGKTWEVVGYSADTYTSNAQIGQY